VLELPDVPDFVAAREAWRVWRVVMHDGDFALASAVMGTVWPICRPLVAECRHRRWLRERLRNRPPHPAPALQCECGIYGATLEVSSKYLDQELPCAVTRVLGLVALWGTVVESERGLRASHAYPRVLFVSGTGNGTRTGTAVAAGLSRYGVPIEPAEHDCSLPA
jgi:hypothetical protein